MTAVKQCAACLCSIASPAACWADNVRRVQNATEMVLETFIFGGAFGVSVNGLLLLGRSRYIGSLAFWIVE